MRRTLIVDDEAPARDKLRRWLGEQADIEIVGEAADGLAAAKLIASTQPDLVFLDIQMPALSGLEVAAQLPIESAPLIVFVTAFSEHAVRAFDMNAVDYLLKPYDRERLDRTLARIRERAPNRSVRAKAVELAREQTRGSERLLVPDGERLTLIERDSIRWLEADDNYVRLHTNQGNYTLRRPLQELIAQLGEAQFKRIHKSAAINITEIAALHPLFKGDYEVELRNGERLRLSRRFTEELFRRLGR